MKKGRIPTMRKSIVIVFVLCLVMACFSVVNPISAKADSIQSTTPAYGDANCDGEVNVADVVLVMSAIVNPDRYGLGAPDGISMQGCLCADVYNQGSGITNNDALAIQLYITGSVSRLPIGSGELSMLSTVAMTTTTKATTTTTKETTTTIKTTTTRIKTTTTTTKAITTTAVTTVSGPWSAPNRDDCIHDGEKIPNSTYKSLKNAAIFFGIDRYEIVWSDHPVEYAIADPGMYYCLRNGIAYGYGMQIIPSEDVKTVCPNIKKLKENTYKRNSELIAFRPLVGDDDDENVLANYADTESAYKEGGMVVATIDDLIETNRTGEEYLSTLESLNWNNSFEHINWYLVPIDENGQKVEKVITDGFNMNVKTSAEVNYFVSNDELTCCGVRTPISRVYFERFVNTAKQLRIKQFKIAYNEMVNEPPVFYSFMVSRSTTVTATGAAVQVVPGRDVEKIIDLNALCMNIANGQEDIAAMYYDDLMNQKLWYWTKACNDVERNTTEENVVYTYLWTDEFDGYYMIPLNSDGTEDLRLFIS